MEKYPNAVIYRLKCYTTKTYYIGSTVNLKLRMRTHKGKKNDTTSKSIIEGGNYEEPKILMCFPCNDKKELRELEQGFINTYREKYGDSVLNEKDAYLTEEERKEKDRLIYAKWAKNNPDKVKTIKDKYYQKNPDKVRKRSALYYQNNKETLCEKFNCECGGTYQKRHKPSHIKTKIHQNFIQSQNQNQTQKQQYEAHEG